MYISDTGLEYRIRNVYYYTWENMISFFVHNQIHVHKQKYISL